jgi:hypothetical protein
MKCSFCDRVPGDVLVTEGNPNPTGGHRSAPRPFHCTCGACSYVKPKPATKGWWQHRTLVAGVVPRSKHGSHEPCSRVAALGKSVQVSPKGGCGTEPSWNLEAVHTYKGVRAGFPSSEFQG